MVTERGGSTLLPCCPSASGLLANLTDHPSALSYRGFRAAPPTALPLVLGLGAPAARPLVPTEYSLDARRVNRLHGLVDPEKRPTPCKGRVLAKTAATVGEGKGKGEGEGSGGERKEGGVEKRKEKRK